MDIFSSSYILYFYNIWRPSTFLCTYGKKLYMGIGMLIKMRTIGLDRQSALLNRESFAVKVERKTIQFAFFFLLMYSRQRRCDVENPIIVYKSVLSNASE